MGAHHRQIGHDDLDAPDLAGVAAETAMHVEGRRDGALSGRNAGIGLDGGAHDEAAVAQRCIDRRRVRHIRKDAFQSRVSARKWPAARSRPRRRGARPARPAGRRAHWRSTSPRTCRRCARLPRSRCARRSAPGRARADADRCRSRRPAIAGATRPDTLTPSQSERGIHHRPHAGENLVADDDRGENFAARPCVALRRARAPPEYCRSDARRGRRIRSYSR